jgi:hypothetical protein
MHVEHGRGFLDARHLLLSRGHVVHSEVVSGGDVGGGIGHARVFRPDDVCPHSFNLRHHIGLAGERDGHDQNQGRSTDGHAEGGHRSAHLVGAQGIQTHGQDFAQDDRPTRIQPARDSRRCNERLRHKTLPLSDDDECHSDANKKNAEPALGADPLAQKEDTANCTNKIADGGNRDDEAD